MPNRTQIFGLCALGCAQAEELKRQGTAAYAQQDQQFDNVISWNVFHSLFLKNPCCSGLILTSEYEDRVVLAGLGVRCRAIHCCPEVWNS